MVFTVVVMLVLGSYVLFTQRVVSRLQEEAAREGEMYARVYRAINDTLGDPMSALFELAQHVRTAGIPTVLTDADGRVDAAENTPYDSSLTDPRLAAYIAALDAENEPIRVPNAGTVHFGNPRTIKELQIVPILQAAVLGLVLLAAVWAFRQRATADRERVWAGMARESAHQLGTPLMSLNGWIELLRDRSTDPMSAKALDHMEGDLERLARVAHRFERIGRPPKREELDLVAIVQRVADYFRARVPTLAQSVVIETDFGNEHISISGDAVLVEWAIESLVKNSLDALAGRGGRIRLTIERFPELVRLVVSDDGPGVARDLRRRVFEPGFSTKKSGWGLGLALTRRIVEEAHHGKIALMPSDVGAVFQITFPG